MIAKFLSAKSDVIGKTVYDTVEEKVGVIQDIFIDPKSNRPVFAFMEEGGFLGIGSDTYALPWPMLEFNTNSGNIILQVRRNKIADAPELDLDKLRNNDREEVSSLMGYYGHNDFLSNEDVDQEDYQAERNTNHPHQDYEGSAKTTNETPESHPAEDVNYDKMKGLE